MKELNVIISKEVYQCPKCSTILYKYRARPGLYCDKCGKYYYNISNSGEVEVKLETDKGVVK